MEIIIDEKYKSYISIEDLEFFSRIGILNIKFSPYYGNKYIIDDEEYTKLYTLYDPRPNFNDRLLSLNVNIRLIRLYKRINNKLYNILNDDKG